MNAKTIIGFINTTLKGYTIATGNDLTKERSHKIIDGIVGGLDIRTDGTREVLDYCNNYYGYTTARHTNEALFDHVNEALRMLKKSVLPIVFLFLSFSSQAQFITTPEDDINTQFGLYVDPTLTDSGAQVGVFATMVMHFGYVEASISKYIDPDPERIAYKDIVGELGLNGHFGGYEPIRAFAGFRLGFISRGGKGDGTYPMVGGALGFDWQIWEGFFVGVKLWTDYREDQKDQFYGSAAKYERGLVTNNPLLQENGALRVSFSF